MQCFLHIIYPWILLKKLSCFDVNLKENLQLKQRLKKPLTLLSQSEILWSWTEETFKVTMHGSTRGFFVPQLSNLSRYYIFIFFPSWFLVLVDCFAHSSPQPFWEKCISWRLLSDLLHIFISASCIIFSSKAVQLSDSRLPADWSGDSSDTNFCFSFVSWLYRLLFAIL